jgi:hypothetical protein
MSVDTEQPTQPRVVRVSAAIDCSAIVIGLVWPRGTNHSIVMRTHVEII